ARRYNQAVTSTLLPRLRRLGSVASRTAAVSYCAVLLVLVCLENALLYPAPKCPEGDWEASYLQRQDVTFTSADGTQLHGWLVEHASPRAVLMYCHGNGDCLGYLGPLMQELRDKHQLTV